MSDNKEVTIVEPSQEVQDWTLKLQKEFKFGEGNQNELPKDFVEKNLPEGMTMATIASVQNLGSVLTAALANANGLSGLEKMRKDRSIERVSSSLKFGADTISTDILRRAEYANPKDRETKIVKHGVITVGYESHGAGASRGQVARVKKSLSARAEELFGK